MAYFPREINFLIAAVSTKNNMLKYLLKLVNFIPTRRPQDEAYQGSGKIVSVKGNTLKARDSFFTTNLGEKCTVVCGSPKSEFFVKKVIDDETLEIDNPKGIDIEKELDFKVIPKLDQSAMFDNCWKLLAEGKVVGIFPEVRVSSQGRIARSARPASDQGRSGHHLHGGHREVQRRRPGHRLRHQL